MYCNTMVLNTEGRLCEMTQGHNKLFTLKDRKCVLPLCSVCVFAPRWKLFESRVVSFPNTKCLNNLSPVGPKQVASRCKETNKKKKFKTQFPPEDTSKISQTCNSWRDTVQSEDNMVSEGATRLVSLSPNSWC